MYAVARTFPTVPTARPLIESSENAESRAARARGPITPSAASSGDDARLVLRVRCASAGLGEEQESVQATSKATTRIVSQGRGSVAFCSSQPRRKLSTTVADVARQPVTLDFCLHCR